jgi:hypothetical protein
LWPTKATDPRKYNVWASCGSECGGGNDVIGATACARSICSKLKSRRRASGLPDLGFLDMFTSRYHQESVVL